MVSILAVAAICAHISSIAPAGYGQYRPIAIRSANSGYRPSRQPQYPSNSPSQPEFSLNPNPSLRQPINSRRPVPPPQNTMCMSNGKAFKSGAEIPKDECNTCKCEKGQWKCTDRECMSRCEVFGDPHYKTFDGKRFDFMGRCSYYLMKTDYGVDIIGENDDCPWGHTEQSCTKSVNIRVKHDDTATTIGLKQDRRVEVNGVDMTEELPFSVLNGFIYIRPASSTMLMVMFGDGLQLLWDGYTSAYIDAPAAVYSNKTNGLCGNMDGDSENDFQTPDGSDESSPDTFGNEWRVKEVCDADNSTADIPHPCQGNPRIQRQSQQICSILQSPVFGNCNVDPAPYLDNCLVDLCQCKGNPATCMCTVFTAYANECSRSGNPVNWRQFIPDCAVECPAGQVYEECSDKCFTSCADLKTKNKKCNKNCVAGCRCPDGAALDENKQCIPIDACPKSENDDNNYNDEDDNQNDYDQQDKNQPDYPDKDTQQPNQDENTTPRTNRPQKPKQKPTPKPTLQTPEDETETPTDSPNPDDQQRPQVTQKPQKPKNKPTTKPMPEDETEDPTDSQNTDEPDEMQQTEQPQNERKPENPPKSPTNRQKPTNQRPKKKPTPKQTKQTPENETENPTDSPNPDDEQQPEVMRKPQKPQKKPTTKPMPEDETENPTDSQTPGEPDEPQATQKPLKPKRPQNPRNPKNPNTTPKPKKKQQSPEQQPQDSQSTEDPDESQQTEQPEEPKKEQKPQNPARTPKPPANKRKPTKQPPQPNPDTDEDDQQADTENTPIDNEEPPKDMNTPPKKPNSQLPKKPANNRRPQRPRKQPEPPQPENEDPQSIDENPEGLEDPENLEESPKMPPKPSKRPTNQRKPNQQKSPPNQDNDDQPDKEGNSPDEDEPSPIEEDPTEQTPEKNPSPEDDEEQPESCKTKPMQDAETIGLVEVFSPRTGKCVNSRPIQGMTVCGGACQSGTTFNRKTMQQDSTCGCCKPAKLEALDVPVECQDGSQRMTQVSVPMECECGGGCGGGNDESENIRIESNYPVERLTPNDDQLSLLFSIRDQLVNRRGFGY